MSARLSEARFLVTGGSGMIGPHLIRRLVACGARPFVFTRDPAAADRLAPLGDAVVFLAGDIRDEAAIRDAVRRAAPDIVFHLASSFFNPPTLAAADHMAINATGQLHLCLALEGATARDGRPPRLVTTGSCAVYAGGDGLAEDAPINPGSVYGVSKAAASAVAAMFAARESGGETIELRLFTPFGPGEATRRLIPDTILSARAGRTVEIGHGGQTRDFVFIDDVIDALERAATVPLAGPMTVVNIGAGHGRSIRSVAESVLALMGDPVALKIGARPTRADEIWTMSADIATARSVLGWSPATAFDDGLRRTIDWFVDDAEQAARPDGN